MNTIVRGQDRQKNNFENKNQIFEKKYFQTFFLHGEKENFEEYSLNLASAELSFPILINYLEGKCQMCPRTTVKYMGKQFLSKTDFLFKSYDKKLVFCEEWAASFPTGHEGKKLFFPNPCSQLLQNFLHMFS
jgi:hypothetical protein